jgi:hypothetical protein
MNYVEITRHSEVNFIAQHAVMDPEWNKNVILIGG